jgi:hypothetical protein
MFCFWPEIHFTHEITAGAQLAYPLISGHSADTSTRSRVLAYAANTGVPVNSVELMRACLVLAEFCSLVWNDMRCPSY